ncbi:MAG: flavin reductase family protein [Nitrososphaerota archaeon]|nr:flavin reductase family protein [Nitrososphaerota archaeon]
MKVNPSLIHRLFYPQVPLVMAAQSGGRVSAMPVVSYTSVSDSPSLLAVACNPWGFTCKLALKAGSFSLSVLDRDHADAIARMATTSGAKAKDKLADLGLKHTRGTRLDVPVIEDALATLECKLESRKKVGDHLLLVGRVEAAYASGAFTDFWDFTKYKPLLYTGWREGLTTYPGS